MVLVDTNILAYLLIDDARTAHARTLLARDPDWHSESLSLVELVNVLATIVRVRRLALRSATVILEKAETVLAGGLHSVDHTQALAVAARHGISGYDARFIALANELGVPLITEDAGLRKAVPAMTRSLADAVSGS